MKQTSKQKALKYIREKNAYNRGKEVMGVIKVSNISVVNYKPYIESNSDHQIEWLNKKYKINFKLVSAKSALCDDDFIRDLTTVLLTFKKA
tara:strand:- start:4049 stop:4321 length:273 start_codon:yes stop_codon:yes gene_type:complete